MKVITSKDNQIYKLCGKLALRKYRDRYGQYLIEGEKLIQEAIKTGNRLIMVVAVKSYATDLKDLPCPLVYAQESLFAQMAQTETSQGILAIVEKNILSESVFGERIREKSGNVVVLDRLQDPGNIGTIIRTADAAGYSGVMTIKGTGDIFSPKVVRAAAGSLFRIPVFAADSPEQAVSLLEAAGKTVVATGFDADLFYYETDLRRNVGLIIGNEGNGISPELMRMARKTIKIPMSGSIDSLNAAVAAGILMYEAIRN